MNMLNAYEALDQGLEPPAFLSIARFNERAGNHEVAARARQVGLQMASIVGMDLGGHQSRRRAAANDNGRRRRAA